MTARRETAAFIRLSIIAALIAAIGITMIWVIRFMPTICPAVYPAPPSCSPDARAWPAVWSTVAVSIFFAAAIGSGLVWPMSRERVMGTVVLVLGAATLAGMTVTLLASGFAVLW
jgi:hypothetical protein